MNDTLLNNYVKSANSTSYEHNQLYRYKLTVANNSNVADLYFAYSRFNVNNNFIKITSDDTVIIKGRKYDAALAMDAIDFTDKIVCEVGARDGIFCSYLTQYANKVYVSDYFEEWGKDMPHDLGPLDYWSFIWKKSATNPDRLICEHQNVLFLTYPDNMFDVVIATHVINYLIYQKDNGDIAGLKELVRVCKPGGKIVISLLLGPDDRSCQGTHVYSNKTLFERLILESGCKLLGNTFDFDLSNKYNDGLFELDELCCVSDVFFILVKNC